MHIEFIVTDKCWWKGKLHTPFSSFSVFKILRKFPFFLFWCQNCFKFIDRIFCWFCLFFFCYLFCAREKKNVWSGQSNIYLHARKNATPLENSKKKNENIGIKKAGSVLLHRKVAGSVVCCCCYCWCFCVKISSRRIVSRACRNFFRVVFFLADFFPLVVIIVDDGECCYCCCFWWYGSITWICVCMCAVDLCIGWLVYLFCLPHSSIHVPQCYRDFGYRMQFRRWCRMVWMVCFGGRITRIADRKYRTESFFTRFLSLCLTHTLQKKQQHHNGKRTHQNFPKCKRSPPIVKTTSGIHSRMNVKMENMHLRQNGTPSYDCSSIYI